MEWVPLAFVSFCPQIRGRCWPLHELGDYFHLHFLSEYSYPCCSSYLSPVAVTMAGAIVSLLLA